MEAWVLALVGSPWVFVVLYLFATIDGFFPPIPSESIVIALAALAVAQGEPSLPLVILVAAAGAFTGDQIAYQIGTKVKVREVRFLRSARAQAAIDWAERALEHRGASFIIAARYIPVGRVAVNMTAGALGYSRRRFSALAALAAITWGIYSSAIGIGAAAWLGHNPILAVVVGVIGGILLGIVIDWVLRRYHTLAQRRRERVHHAPAVPLRGVDASTHRRAVAEDDAVA
ncbi:DedA family protein [Cellulomonas fimi]|uniref:DedA family protein n=1 Tax=Cellulomonas fimi TaxID=1708 RepID=UPI002359C6F7|nr:DedA family protein [Cellulomonas fimi]